MAGMHTSWGRVKLRTAPRSLCVPGGTGRGGASLPALSIPRAGGVTEGRGGGRLREVRSLAAVLERKVGERSPVAQHPTVCGYSRERFFTPAKAGYSRAAGAAGQELAKGLCEKSAWAKARRKSQHVVGCHVRLLSNSTEVSGETFYNEEC